MTTTDTWFVDDTLTPVNWGSAVVSGQATQPIYQVSREFFLSGPDRVPRMTLWAYPGKPISSSQLATAQALQDSHSLPSFPSGTATEVAGGGGAAPLDSPVFTGIPTAPTAAPGTNTDQVATTAFVHGEVTAIVDSAPGALDTLNELAAALGDDANFAATVTTAIAGKASLGGAPSWMNTLGKISTALNDDAAFATTMNTALGTKVAASGQTGTVNLTGTTLLLPGGFTVKDPADATKVGIFDVSSVAAGQTRTWSMPNSSGTVVLTSNSGTLANKILDTSNTWADSSDNTKRLAWSLAGITAGQTRTVTVPDSNLTIVGTTTTQTVTNKTVDSSVLVAGNVPFVDATDNTKRIRFSVSGVTAGQTRVLTAPDADLTIVGTATSQTLTNKSLDSTTTLITDTTDPTKKIKFDVSAVGTGTTATFIMPSSSATIVGTASTQTLTNKTLSGASNTISNIQQIAAARHNCKAISLMEPAVASSSGALSTGRIYFAKLTLDEAATITGVRTAVSAVGSGLTAGSNFMGLYDMSGNQLAITADLTTTAFVTAGNQDVPFTTPYAAAAGSYLVAILSVGSTPVGLARQGISSTSPYAHNLGTTGVNSRFSSFTTTSQTSLPASINPASITGATSLPFLVGLY